MKKGFERWSYNGSCIAVLYLPNLIVMTFRKIVIIPTKSVLE
jgi:hypothetical protein